jgi:NADH dehydrogenase/NADH:ubiquinone oxidoreductase subunit G
VSAPELDLDDIARRITEHPMSVGYRDAAALLARLRAAEAGLKVEYENAESAMRAEEAAERRAEAAEARVRELEAERAGREQELRGLLRDYEKHHDALAAENAALRAVADAARTMLALSTGSSLYDGREWALRAALAALPKDGAR